MSNAPTRPRRQREVHPHWARYCELSRQLRAIYGESLSALILTQSDTWPYERRGMIGVSSARTVLSPAPDTSPLDLLDELWDLLGEGDWLLAAPDASDHAMRCAPLPSPTPPSPLPWPLASAAPESDPCLTPTPLPHSNALNITW